MLKSPLNIQAPRRQKEHTRRGKKKKGCVTPACAVSVVDSTRPSQIPGGGGSGRGGGTKSAANDHTSVLRIRLRSIQEGVFFPPHTLESLQERASRGRGRATRRAGSSKVTRSGSLSSGASTGGRGGFRFLTEVEGANARETDGGVFAIIAAAAVAGGAAAFV